MPATVNLAPLAKQRFVDNNGVPLAGGKIFTYAAGSTTKQASYTDSTGGTPNANPIVLDSRGEASIWLDQTLAYKIVLSPSSDTDPPTAPIWTQDGLPASGFLAFVIQLATSAGASLIGFINSGVGAVVRTLQAVLRGRVRIRDFGAACDGVTDDTAAIQAAIVYAAQAFPSNSWFDRVFALTGKGAPRRVDFEGATCKVSGKILVPTGLDLDGGQCTLIGTGNTAGDNVCFESAYFNSSTLTSNIGTANETQVLQALRIRGFKFLSFKLALNMFDVGQGSEFKDLDFGSCYQAGVFNRCFYARFISLTSNENIALAASTLPAFDFQNFVNAETIEGVRVNARPLGIQFTGTVNGLSLREVTVENGTTGIVFTGGISSLNIGLGCYFESLTGVAIDMTAPTGHGGVVIEGAFFNNLGTAIAGVNMFSGRIGAGNTYQACTNKVVIADIGSAITVEIPSAFVLDNVSTVPTVPAGFNLATTVNAVFPVTVTSSVDGTAQARSKALVNNFADLPYFGQAGHVTNQVAFCTVTHTGTTTATVNIDTKINFDVYLRWMFYVKVVDGSGSTFMWGDVWGTNVNAVNAASKTITVSNNGGYFRLTISTFNTPVDAQCEGIVRIV